MNQEIEKEIQNCIHQLRNKGIAIIPTETGWAITTDLSNVDFIEQIIINYDFHYPVVLLKESGQLQKYFNEIPDVVYDFIEFSNRPVHLFSNSILNNPLSLNTNDNPTYFRIVKDEFTSKLLYKFGKPLFAIHIVTNERLPKDSLILKEHCYVVNLRLSAKSNTDDLVILKFFPGGQFEFIKK